MLLMSSWLAFEAGVPLGRTCQGNKTIWFEACYGSELGDVVPLSIFPTWGDRQVLQL